MPTKKKSPAKKSPAPKKAASKKAAAKKSPAKSAPTKSVLKKAAAAKRIPAKKDAAKNLSQLFEDGLKDLYWAEKALLKTMPKMHKNAAAPKLKEAIAEHMTQTQNQVTRLEACFTSLGTKAQAKKCAAMQGIIEEGEELIKESMPGAVRDAAIVAAAQKAEHYEIASYGTLAAFAKVLQQKECLNNLLETLAEEKQADMLLTSVADTGLNSMAME